MLSRSAEIRQCRMKNDKWKMENQNTAESLSACSTDKKFPSDQNTLPVGGELLWTALENSAVQSLLEFHSGRPGGWGRQRLRLWHIDDRGRSWLRLRLHFHHRRRFLFFLWTGDRTT